MPLNCRLSGMPVFRRFVSRAHGRAERLPALPFAVALAASAVLLAAAIEFEAAPAEARVETVDELTLADGDAYGDAYSETPGELEIAEVGFGTVTGADGIARVSVGAVLRNPHEVDLIPGRLTVTAPGDGSERVGLEEIYVDRIPAEAEVPLGQVLRRGAEGIDVDSLELESAQSFLIDYEGAGLAAGEASALPEVEVVGVEPLFAPAGSRIVFRVDLPGEAAAELRLSVVFRDAHGRIVGGMPGGADPLAPESDAASPVRVPVAPGVSVRYLDLPEERIPVGADLDRVEIGPAG